MKTEKLLKSYINLIKRFIKVCDNNWLLVERNALLKTAKNLIAKTKKQKLNP